MTVGTKYGDIEIDETRKCECELYLDCSLLAIPPALQKHIDEVIAQGKERAFAERKAECLKSGSQTLDEFEKGCRMEVSHPYIGIQLDVREEELKAGLYVDGYGSTGDAIKAEFHYIESIAIRPEVLTELLLLSLKKNIPSVLTMSPVIWN